MTDRQQRMRGEEREAVTTAGEKRRGENWRVQQRRGCGCNRRGQATTGVGVGVAVAKQ